VSTTSPAPRDFFERPVDLVARELLGARVVHDGVAVRLTEVEAYDGPNDPASHAYRGPTARNRVMFGPAGHLYVYRSHGLHWCANVTTGPPGVPSAVLLRAGVVVDGHELAHRRRGPAVTAVRLARGPGNLGQALGLARSDDGEDLCGGGRVQIFKDPAFAGGTVRCGPRVGVSVAADVDWRFWLDGEPTVSAYRRSPRAVSTSARDVRSTRTPLRLRRGI